MNDENEIERDQGSGIGDQGAGLVVPHASEADEVRQALLTSSIDEEGPTAAAAARKLQGYVYKAHALSQLPESEFKTEQERFAAAEAIARGMTGQDDPLGRLWNGGKGFETGGEYLRSVKETFMRGMQAAATPRLQQYLAADEDEKNRLASEAAGFFRKAWDSSWDLAMGAEGFKDNTGPLDEGEMASAPDDVREASEALKSAMIDEDPAAKRAAQEKVGKWRVEGKHLMEYRAAYEEKLMRENALMFLPDVLRHVKSEDARKLCSEIIEHPDRHPDDYKKRLEALDTGDIEIIGRINHMVTPRGGDVVGNFLGDIALAPLRTINSKLRGLAAQLDKVHVGLNNLGAELLTDEPEMWKLDYNARLRRRTALWAAGEGLGADINQYSEDHGMAASALISIAGVLPDLRLFNSAAGLATLTVDGMAQMDERMVREGVDVTDPKYVAGSMLAAGLQTYVMKRGFAKTFGAKMTEKEAIEIQTAWLKGVMAGLSKMPTYRNLTAHTLGGAMAMGLSAGIGEINAAVAKNGIDADALAEGGKAFVEEFVGSIPDMAVFAASGMLKGHAERSGGFRRMFTDAGLATRDAGLKGVMERKYTWLSSQRVSKELDDLRLDLAQRWIAHAHEVYSNGGKDALAKRFSFDAGTVDELADLFEDVRMHEGSRPTPATSASEEPGVKSEKSGGRRKGRGRRKDYYRAQVDERRRERDIENWNRQDEDINRRANRIVTRLFENRENAERLIDELEPIRNIWAKGGGMIETETKDGKEITNDPGQAALIKAGFSEETAKEFSDIFREEQRRRCSPAAFNGIQAIYERSTRGMTTARGQLDSVLPKGRVTERDGMAFVNFTKPTGESVDAVIARGEAKFTLEDVSGTSGDNMAGQVEKETKGKVKAADWKEMTPEKRLETVKRYNLVQAGNFVLTDPHDPSITVDTDGARRIVGRIETPAVGGKPFHEVTHGFCRFMQESGAWNEEDIKWLRETFGEPRAKNELFDKDGNKVRRDELFNEEPLCDAVQAYAAKKLNGSLTDEPPALRKLWTFARRMVHLTERRVAEEKLAADREQALYDAILTGTFSHIADLKVAEKPVAPKPSEGGEGAAAPQTGTLPKEPGRFKTVTKTPETVTKTPETVTETGTEAAKPLEGAAKPEVRPEVTFEALTPTGGKKIRGHYEFVPLAKLLHSNKPGYPMELQGRDRKDNKAEQQTRNDHVANFEAGYLLADPKTDSGAMVVVKRPAEGGGVEYVVVSGNGRTMVLEDLAAKNLYDRYRNPVKAFAAENGIENGVPDGENPVLVRVIDDLGGATLKEIADLSNTNAIQQMNEEEQARADAGKILELDIARLYAANADGSPNMTPGANADFFREFVKGIGDTGMLNSDGSVTEALRLRAQRALLAIACGQGERGRDTVKALVEQAATLGIERQKEAAAAMAPHVAAAEARPEFAIGPDVSRAFADFLDFMRNRDTGKKWGTVEEYLKQGDMLDPRSEIAGSILRMLGERKSPGYVAEVARVYAEAAKGEQDGLFGEARKPAEIWREAEKSVAEDGGKRWSVVKIGDSDVAVAETEPLTTKEANDEKKVRAILDAVVGNEYRQLGETKLVKVSPAFPDEFWKSNDSERLRRKHEKLWRAKVSAVPVLGEIIGNTKLGPAEAARHINRDFKERATFYRCETKFGIKRWNGVAVYPCDLLLFELDGRRFVYDILNVRKPTLTAAENLGEETRRRLYDGGTLAGESVANARSIAQSGAGGNGRRWSIGQLYTGSAADYEKPSLLKVGTGEGSQVYGWGLYASDRRNVAEVYSNRGNTFKILKDGKEVSIRDDDAAWHIGRFANGGSVNKAKVDARARIKAGDDPEFYKKVLKDISAHKYEIVRGTQNVYEQTFFTNRAPGDESHLLKWYEPVSEENKQRVVAALKPAITDKFGLKNYSGFNTDDVAKIIGDAKSGQDLYERVSTCLMFTEEGDGSQKSASEFLARADIDGIKYPVDSYGGKTVKDGDKAGWNYVSFRDDNIRVDHKWVDGQQRWSIATRLDEERQLIEERGGQLLLAHHGTDSRGFTRFEKSDDIGYFFAKSRNTAASYIRKGRRGDENRPGLTSIEDLDAYFKSEWSGRTPEEVAAMSYEEKAQACLEETGDTSGVYDVALKMEDPYVIDCHGAAWNAIYEIPDDTRSDTTTYDRVILDYNSITGKFGFWRREYIEDRNDWVPGKEAGVDKVEFDDFESFRKHVIQEMGDTFAMDELEEIKRKAENDEDVSYEPVNGSQEKSEAGMMWAFDSASGEGWGVFPRKTREIVEDAANMGCDGVIFHNVVDNGGGIREADADDVYVVMKPEQVKSVDSMTCADDGSIIPAEKRIDWTNPDIRWSIAKLASGEDCVVLDRNEEIAKINLNDPKSLHDYLVGKVGERLFDNIVVGSDAPDEYVYSKDAQGNNKRVRKAKAKLATGLDEAAAAAGEASTEQAAHKEREGGVYYRRRFLFAAPSGFGGDYRAYSADMISYKENGVEQFYDVVNIEDAPTASADLTQTSARIAANGTSRIPADGGATPRSIAQSAADGNADNDPFFALGNQKRRREAERRDPEAVARQAIVALTQGGEEDKTSALVAFVAYRDLTGGAKPRAKTISTLGFQMGMKTVAVGKIVREGEGLAKRMRDTVISQACERGDVATAMAMLARERMADAAAKRIVSGAAQRGGYLKEKGEIAQKAIMEREISKLVRATNAATLEDMERDTGLDLASEILAADPDRFDPNKREEGRGMRDEGAADDSGDGGVDGADAPADVPFDELTDLQKARRKERQAAAEKRVAEMIEKAKARAEKKAANHKANADAAGRDLENQAAFDAENGGEGGGGAAAGAAGAAEAEKPDLKTFADFKTKEEFAAFLRAWATDAFAKSIGIRELTKAGKHRLFAEFYRKTVIRELSDLADKLLPPKGARAWANRRLGEIEQGTAPDTIERISGDVFALINRNAIREERTALIQKFRNDVRRYYNGEKFDEFKQDTDRKLTGWIEESARYIHRVCNLAIRSINGEPSQLEQEREKLREIIDKRSEIHDESGKKTVDWAITDDKARRALAKLELLDRFGGMKELMPGEIADRTAEALEYLEKKAGELEKSWEETRRVTEGLIRDFAGGVIGPKGGMRYERGKGVGAWFDGLADALNGMIRLRLRHLTRFADPEEKEAADRAINSFVTMLGDGEVAYSRITDRDRKAFAKALHAIFKGDNARIEEWMNRMTENIPVELSRQISNQGFAEGMTYGQMFQLLVSIEQGSLRPNVEANGRDGQSRLIRDWIIDNPDGTRTRMFTSEDALFVDWLREFYKSTRAEASKVTERMNGMPIYSPDPLYCPVKMWTGDVKRDWHGDTGRWDPVGSVFARRVENLRDFDESASVLGMFFDRSAARAQLIAWAERGTILRNVFTDVGVRSSIERAFGKGEYSRIAKQIEQTMTGGEGAKKTPGEIAAADKAMNYITYASLGFNPLSAMKQTTSFPVWANAIGWTRLWHHMTHFDKAALKHLMESEEFKVRYGDQVNGGMDIATRGLNENPGRSRVAQMFQKWSMGLLKLGDFAPGGWIAQGVYKDFLDKHLKEGMEFDAANHLSITETFNLLEETQQSGRTYNTNELSREHGRIGRLLTQFATSPLQQLQYQMQAIREVRDLWRYRPAAKDAAWEKNFADAKAKLVRAAVINHVLLPAALHAVTNIYKLAMGYDPEWEQDGWHQTLLRDLLLGQFSRVFYIGTMAETTFDALFAGKRPTFLTLLPAEGAITQVANIAFTARDVFMGMDPDKMRKDIDRLLKSTSVTRTPYDLIWRATGRDMNQRKEFIKKGRMPK